MDYVVPFGLTMDKWQNEDKTFGFDVNKFALTRCLDIYTEYEDRQVSS